MPLQSLRRQRPVGSPDRNDPGIHVRGDLSCLRFLQNRDVVTDGGIESLTVQLGLDDSPVPFRNLWGSQEIAVLSEVPSSLQTVRYQPAEGTVYGRVCSNTRPTPAMSSTGITTSRLPRGVGRRCSVGASFQEERETNRSQHQGGSRGADAERTHARKDRRLSCFVPEGQSKELGDEGGRF